MYISNSLKFLYKLNRELDVGSISIRMYCIVAVDLILPLEPPARIQLLLQLQTMRMSIRAWLIFFTENLPDVFGTMVLSVCLDVGITRQRMPRKSQNALMTRTALTM